MRKNIRINNKKGFSLVEVLISLLILTLGIGAVSALMVQNIKTSETAKNQIIASELAQEGVELMRNYKDNSYKNGVPVFGSDPATKQCLGHLPDGKTYRIGKNIGSDCFTPVFATDGDTNVYPIYIDDGSYGCGTTVAGFYAYSVSCTLNRIKTKFFREVRIYNNTSKQQVEAISVVTWNGLGVGAIDTGDSVVSNWCTIASKCVSAETIFPDPTN